MVKAEEGTSVQCKMGQGQNAATCCTGARRRSSWHYPAPRPPPAFHTCGEEQVRILTHFLCFSKRSTLFLFLNCHLSLILPVWGGDGVIDRQLAAGGDTAELLQTASAHVGEEEPVSHQELW